MADSDPEDLPGTTRTNEELVDLIQLWKQENAERCVIVVVAGKSGTGKSTLINNFVTLDPGQERPEARRKPTSVTKKVGSYDGEVNGVRIRAVDMPGLHARKDSADAEKEAVAFLHHETDGKADLLMYCVSLTQRLDSIDERNIETLVKAFGEKIWDDAIFVLTHADTILDESEYDNTSTSLHDLVKEFTEELRSILAKSGIEMCIKPLRLLCMPQSTVSNSSALTEPRCDGGNGATTSRSVQISVIPSGKKSSKPPHWKEALLAQIIEICRNRAVSNLTELQGVSKKTIDERVKKGLAVGAAAGVVGGVSGAALGAGIGSAIGAVIGGILTAPIGGVGAVPTAIGGAELGAMIGSLFGGGGLATVAFFAGGITNARKNNLFEDIAYHREVEKKLAELRKKEQNESS